MADKENTIFREKNLKKATDPEALNGYLKVTGFGAWAVVIVAALILAAIFIWGAFGRITPVISGAGECVDRKMTCYFPQAEASQMSVGAKVDIEGTEGIITEIGKDLFMMSDIPYTVLFLLPESDAVWYSEVDVDCDLEDGFYRVKYEAGDIRPASFMTQDNKAG